MFRVFCLSCSETDIKVVSMLNMSHRTFRGHEGAVRSLSYDPDGDLLASASSDGTVKIWTIEGETCTQSLSVLPRGAASTLRIDWHPAGKLLAIPIGTKVVVYERDSWDELYSFGGDEGHTKEVSIACWSPNGEYLATVSINGEVIVWETKKRQSLGRFKHREGLAITSVAWHPKGNEIAWADSHGKFSVWKEPVPEAAQFAAPVGGDAAATATEEGAQNLASLFAEDDDDDDVGAKRKRVRKKKAKVTDDDEDDGIVTSVPPELEAAAAAEVSEDEYEDRGGAVGRGYELATQQPPFQPSSTPEEELRRIMVWNNVGVITSREEDISCSVDVEFHNVQKHKPIRMIDHFGFTVGALSETCFVMGGPSRSPNGVDERDNPSVLFCRSINHWATDDSWQIFFPEGEEIEVVAVGGGETGFVAAATNKQMVRLYTTTGIPKFIFTLDGPVVSMAAKDEQLLVVYHQASTAGGQCLGYVLYDVDTWTVTRKDRLPTPGDTTVTWCGFTDDGMAAYTDSNEVVRVLVNARGFIWVPLVELKAVAKNASDNHWIIGVSDSDVLCVICKGAKYPKVLPRPITTTVQLHMPLVSLTDTVKKEEAFIRSKITFDHLVKAEGLDEDDAEDRRLIQQYQHKMDQHIIHCISRAVQAQKPGRALDLTTSLHLSTNIDVAIKLAVKAKLPLLADRMMLAKQANVERKATEYHARRATKSGGGGGYPDHADNWSDNAASAGAASRGGHPTQDDVDDVEDAPETEDAAEAGDELAFSPQRRKPLKPKTNTGGMSVSKKAFQKAKVANPFAKTTPVKKPSSAGIGDLGVTASPGKPSVTDASPSGGDRKHTLSFLKAPTDTAAKKRKKDPNAPKKALSAYFLWLQANRTQLKADNPGIKNQDVLKKAGEAWGALDAEEKAKWNAVAEEKKEEYKTAKAEYDDSLVTKDAVDDSADTDVMAVEPAAAAV
jgi:chromosome transmission fidelity protein 4